MKIDLAYGKGIQSVMINSNRVGGVLVPPEIAGVDENEEMRRAIENPVGTDRLSAIVGKGEKVCIVTSDVTRPCPSYKMLPFVLEELHSAGIPDSDITIVFALGAHRKHTPEEIVRLVGAEIAGRIRCIDLDVEDCIALGSTEAGTPLEIFRPVVEADRRICLGNIEYHYFAGYSGGAKAILPGVATKAAIQANHSMMLDDKAATGILEGNPVREDIDSMPGILPIDFIFNVVLGPQKQILKAVAGHYIEAHREGCAYLDTIYKFPLTEAADIVLVTPGGFPKDINVYQAQKALDNAAYAVRPGGIIIWVAQCGEGYGSEKFTEWMNEAENAGDLTRRVQEKFELGGHKAAAMALVRKKAAIWMVSDLSAGDVENMFCTPVRGVQEALDNAFQALGPDAKVLIMPNGGSTLPSIQSSDPASQGGCGADAVPEEAAAPAL